MIVSVYEEQPTGQELEAYVQRWWLIGVRERWSSDPRIVGKTTDQEKAEVLRDELIENPKAAHALWEQADV